MKKLVLLISLLLTSWGLFAQATTQRFINVKPTYTLTNNGNCNPKPTRADIYYRQDGWTYPPCLVINGGQLGNESYAVIDPSKNVEFYFFDQGQEEIIGRINAPITNNSYNLYANSVPGYACPSAKFQVSLDIKIFDPFHINNIIRDGSCINSTNGNITFQLAANNSLPSRYSVDLIVYQPGGTRWPITLPQSRTININSILTNEMWGKDLYFEVTTYITDLDCGGYANITSQPYNIPLRFYREIDDMDTSISIRTACKDYIDLEFKSSPQNIYNNFHYRAKPAGIDESLSNIIKLIPVSVTGNTLRLVVDATGSLWSFPESGAIDLQIFGKELPWNNLNATCGKIFPNIVLPTKPKPLVLNALRTEYKFPDQDGNEIIYHVTRKGANDGKATLSTDYPNRVERYEYRYSTSPWLTATNPMQNLALNTIYFVRAIDKDGCLSNDVNFTLTSEPENVTFQEGFPTSEPPSCHPNNVGENSNGKLYLGWQGGIGPYNVTVKQGASVIWTASATEEYKPTIPNLKPGTYNIEITDRFGVKLTGSHSITSAPELKIETTPTHNDCFGDIKGKVEINVTQKNTPKVSYEINGSKSSPTSDDTKTYNDLIAGQYTIKVHDEKGCIAIIEEEITEPDIIIIDPTIKRIARYGESTGEIHAQIIGGTAPYDFVYKGTTVVASGSTVDTAKASSLAPSSYSLEIKDYNQCVATAENLKVIQPESRLILTHEKTDIDCHNNSTGSITLSATGGWEPYIFGQNGIVSATNILDGLNYNSQGYNVFVRDDEGVEESINVMLSQPEKLIATINSAHHLKCFEDNSGAIKLNISGGIQPYALSTNQTEWFPVDSLGGFSAGTKTIYFSDKNNCKGSLSATLNQPSKLTIKTEHLDFPECGKNNGTITVSAQGGTNTNGYLYSWQNLNLDQFLTETSHHLSNIKSGKYLTTVFDNNQCKDAIEILLSDIDGPAINEIKIDSVSCNGKEDGSIHITNISGGFPDYQYFLNGNETLPLMENLRAGVYQVSVIDQHDCRLEKRYTVSEPTPIAIDPVMTSPTCYDSNDGVIKLNIIGGNGGYIINWFDGKSTPTLTELTGGRYPVEVSDWKNCKTEETLSLATPNKPAPEWDGEKAVVCTGRTVTLHGGDFDNYKWYKDNDFISDLPDITIGESGIYKLEITDNVGCSGFGLYELGVSESPLDAVLLIADSALVNDAIKGVDVTWPVPDSINWLYSQPVLVLDRNEWSELFSLDKEASLKVTLRAWYQGCFSDTSKTVIIFNNEFENARITNHHMPLIEGFQAYPNPNQGQFSVKVKLSKKVSGSIELIEPKNYYVIHASTLHDQDKYELDFDLHNLSPGIYFLRLKAGNERQVLKLLIY